jgi:hypothetical protein
MEHPFVEQRGLSVNGPIIDVAATGEIRGTMRADRPAARALARLAGSGYHDARVLREPGRRSVPIGADITGGRFSLPSYNPVNAGLERWLSG